MTPPLMPVADALGRVLAAFSPLESETVPLGSALGRTLAEPVVAAISNPPFDASAMDGYAVRASDLVSFARLRPIGESGAGHPFGGTVGAGECVRIFTGAPVPVGADSILVQENATVEHENGARVIIAREGLERGRFVRPTGRDFRAGQTVLEAGRILDPGAIALAGAADVADLSVRRRPRVAILSNGDELVALGTPCKDGQIPASNAAALAALIHAHGGTATDLGIARDSVESIQDLVRPGMRDHDLIVTIGGASVGDRDLIRAALSPMGLDVDFWRIAMRPGKPLIFGKIGPVPFLGLPGNPVSAQVCGFLFVLPAIRRMLGLEPAAPEPVPVRLECAVGGNGPRRAYLRARVHVAPDGMLEARVFTEQDSAYLTPLAATNALVIRPPGADPARTGDMVVAHLLAIPSAAPSAG